MSCLQNIFSVARSVPGLVLIKHPSWNSVWGNVVSKRLCIHDERSRNTCKLCYNTGMVRDLVCADPRDGAKFTNSDRTGEALYNGWCFNYCREIMFATLAGTWATQYLENLQHEAVLWSLNPVVQLFVSQWLPTGTLMNVQMSKTCQKTNEHQRCFPNENNELPSLTP